MKDKLYTIKATIDIFVLNSKFWIAKTIPTKDWQSFLLTYGFLRDWGNWSRWLNAKMAENYEISFYFPLTETELNLKKKKFKLILNEKFQSNSICKFNHRHIQIKWYVLSLMNVNFCYKTKVNGDSSTITPWMHETGLAFVIRCNLLLLPFIFFRIFIFRSFFLVSFLSRRYRDGVDYDDDAIDGFECVFFRTKTIFFSTVLRGTFWEYQPYISCVCVCVCAAYLFFFCWPSHKCT